MDSMASVVPDVFSTVLVQAMKKGYVIAHTSTV